MHRIVFFMHHITNMPDHNSSSSATLQLPSWKLWTMGAANLTNWVATGVFVPCWRLYWCETIGRAWIKCGKQRFEIGPDCFTMIAPNTYIEAGLDKPVRHMWFHFDGGLPYDAVTNWAGQMRFGEDRREGALCLATAIENFSGLIPSAVSMQIAEVISYGMRCVPDDLLHRQLVDPRLTEALRLMRADLTITPAMVCRRLKIGSTTIHRLFHEFLGLTPGKVLALLRLERACRLLVNTDNPLEVIADICGYCDRHHLSHRFSEAYGVGPIEYRKQIQTS